MYTWTVSGELAATCSLSTLHTQAPCRVGVIEVEEYPGPAQPKMQAGKMGWVGGHSGENPEVLPYLFSCL